MRERQKHVGSEDLFLEKGLSLKLVLFALTPTLSRREREFR